MKIALWFLLDGWLFKFKHKYGMRYLKVRDEHVSNDMAVVGTFAQSHYGDWPLRGPNMSCRGILLFLEGST